MDAHAIEKIDVVPKVISIFNHSFAIIVADSALRDVDERLSE